MCGVAGLILGEGLDPARELDRMLDSMHARGPDGEGRFCENGIGLGMRRLAILDPAHGQQPFSSTDGEIVAFVNGEIYNHRELRRELEGHGVRFETNCDSEVLPHAFRIWGPELFPSRLDGMFGIAILDRGHDKLHLYRDRYGEKPIFYNERNNEFRFASQLSTLAVEPDFDFGIDPTSLRQYLALHYVPGSRTMVQDIRKLLPGHRLTVDLSKGRPLEIRSWTDSEERPSVPRNYAAATREVRRLLSDSVTSRMESDVPLGVFLSGGLDSSAVAAIAQQHSPGVETFSMGFEDSDLDESPHAKAVATALGTRHRHFEFGLEACLSVFDDTISALDEPVGDPACLPVYLLSREARRHVKVVLTGEGADEIFGGYAYYPAQAPLKPKVERVLELFRRNKRAANSLPLPESNLFFRSDNMTPSGFPMLTSIVERDAMVPAAKTDEDDWSEDVVSRLGATGCEFERAQVADVLSWLPDDLLTKLDRMTMAASIEGRAPYLEPRLARLALSLPAEWKRTNDRRKRILRDAVAPWLPLEIVDRRKQGFVLPMQRWLVGPLRERLLDGLQGGLVDGLDLDVVRQIAFEDLRRGASRSRFLYGLLAYREWVVTLREARSRARYEVVRDTGSRGAGSGKPGSA
jgi:asparagine synthase (glutamine-hydrolysing)